MRISATSPDRGLRSTAVNRAGNGRQTGFTLLELLVALAIAGLTLTIAPSLFSKAQETIQYRSAVRSVISELRQARMSATALGVSVFFRAKLQERKYGADVTRLKSLPDALEMRMVVGGRRLDAGMQEAMIEFLPDGGATGGSVDIVRRSGEGTRVRVDWISGQIELEPLSK